MKVIYNNIIPFRGFTAINLFGVIFARKECEPLSKRTLNHEAIHTAQMRELLYIGFYIWYVLEWLVKLCFYGTEAYRNISFEREANAGEDDETYLENSGYFEWVKYLKGGGNG